ncbi:GNAT family N-acetyltransferase [Bacillus sp. Marseille-Q3570]|uniref:GNAT family N-acetyltransferase n=1 Tax=Bacillus sp. Marseille-Q3570 TaxID=2963522 RepID=UPI0021B78FB9|nr:GNAT family N-acetyltransferase [Bacillus sp. Marseille-Q3570]
MSLKHESHIFSFQAKNGAEVVIRPALKQDAEQIIKAAESIVQSREYIQKEKTRSLSEEIAFIEKVENEGHLYAVVEVDGVIYGIARVLRGDLRMKRHCGVFRTWISEDVQGNGIGKKIMKYTLDWCEREGLYKLWLTVFSSNPIAHQLYERYGFVIEGTQKDQICINGEYEDEIYMAYFFR